MNMRLGLNIQQKGKIVIRYWFYDCGMRDEKGKNKLPV